MQRETSFQANGEGQQRWQAAAFAGSGYLTPSRAAICTASR
jgi:hypothetical protein